MPEKPSFFVYDDATEEKRRARAVKRWREDGVSTLPQGVSLVQHGRAASLYLREGDRFIALDCELAGAKVDMHVYTEGLSRWVDVNSLETVPTTSDDRRSAADAISAWFKRRPATFEFIPALTNT